MPSNQVVLLRAPAAVDVSQLMLQYHDDDDVNAPAPTRCVRQGMTDTSRDESPHAMLRRVVTRLLLLLQKTHRSLELSSRNNTWLCPAPCEVALSKVSGQGEGPSVPHDDHRLQMSIAIAKMAAARSASEIHHFDLRTASDARVSEFVAWWHGCVDEGSTNSATAAPPTVTPRRVVGMCLVGPADSAGSASAAVDQKIDDSRVIRLDLESLQFDIEPAGGGPPVDVLLTLPSIFYGTRQTCHVKRGLGLCIPLDALYIQASTTTFSPLHPTDTDVALNALLAVSDALATHSSHVAGSERDGEPQRLLPACLLPPAVACLRRGANKSSQVPEASFRRSESTDPVAKDRTTKDPTRNISFLDRTLPAVRAAMAAATGDGATAARTKYGGNSSSAPVKEHQEASTVRSINGSDSRAAVTSFGNAILGAHYSSEGSDSSGSEDINPPPSSRPLRKKETAAVTRPPSMKTCSSKTSSIVHGGSGAINSTTVALEVGRPAPVVLAGIPLPYWADWAGVAIGSGLTGRSRPASPLVSQPPSTPSHAMPRSPPTSSASTPLSSSHGMFFKKISVLASVTACGLASALSISPLKEEMPSVAPLLDAQWVETLAVQPAADKPTSVADLSTQLLDAIENVNEVVTSVKLTNGGADADGDAIVSGVPLQLEVAAVQRCGGGGSGSSGRVDTLQPLAAPNFKLFCRAATTSGNVPDADPTIFPSQEVAFFAQHSPSLGPLNKNTSESVATLPPADNGAAAAPSVLGVALLPATLLRRRVLRAAAARTGRVSSMDQVADHGAGVEGQFDDDQEGDLDAAAYGHLLPHLAHFVCACDDDPDAPPPTGASQRCLLGVTASNRSRTPPLHATLSGMTTGEPELDATRNRLMSVRRRALSFVRGSSCLAAAPGRGHQNGRESSKASFSGREPHGTDDAERVTRLRPLVLHTATRQIYIITPGEDEAWDDALARVCAASAGGACIPVVALRLRRPAALASSTTFLTSQTRAALLAPPSAGRWAATIGPILKKRLVKAQSHQQPHEQQSNPFGSIVEQQAVTIAELDAAEHEAATAALLGWNMHEVVRDFRIPPRAHGDATTVEEDRSLLHLVSAGDALGEGSTLGEYSDAQLVRHSCWGDVLNDVLNPEVQPNPVAARGQALIRAAVCAGGIAFQPSPRKLWGAGVALKAPPEAHQRLAASTCDATRVDSIAGVTGRYVFLLAQGSAVGITGAGAANADGAGAPSPTAGSPAVPLRTDFRRSSVWATLLGLPPTGAGDWCPETTRDHLLVGETVERRLHAMALAVLRLGLRDVVAETRRVSKQQRRLGMAAGDRTTHTGVNHSGSRTADGTADDGSFFFAIPAQMRGGGTPQSLRSLLPPGFATLAARTLPGPFSDAAAREVEVIVNTAFTSVSAAAASPRSSGDVRGGIQGADEANTSVAPSHGRAPLRVVVAGATGSGKSSFLHAVERTRCPAVRDCAGLSADVSTTAGANNIYRRPHGIPTKWHVPWFLHALHTPQQIPSAPSDPISTPAACEYALAVDAVELAGTTAPATLRNECVQSDAIFLVVDACDRYSVAWIDSWFGRAWAPVAAGSAAARQRTAAATKGALPDDAKQEKPRNNDSKAAAEASCDPAPAPVTAFAAALPPIVVVVVGGSARRVVDAQKLYEACARIDAAAVVELEDLAPNAPLPLSFSRCTFPFPSPSHDPRGDDAQRQRQRQEQTVVTTALYRLSDRDAATFRRLVGRPVLHRIAATAAVTQLGRFGPRQAAACIHALMRAASLAPALQSVAVAVVSIEPDPSLGGVRSKSRLADATIRRISAALAAPLVVAETTHGSDDDDDDDDDRRASRIVVRNRWVFAYFATVLGLSIEDALALECRVAQVRMALHQPSIERSVEEEELSLAPLDVALALATCTDAVLLDLVCGAFVCGVYNKSQSIGIEKGNALEQRAREQPNAGRSLEMTYAAVAAMRAFVTSRLPGLRTLVHGTTEDGGLLLIQRLYASLRWPPWLGVELVARWQQAGPSAEACDLPPASRRRIIRRVYSRFVEKSADPLRAKSTCGVHHATLSEATNTRMALRVADLHLMRAMRISPILADWRWPINSTTACPSRDAAEVPTRPPPFTVEAPVLRWIPRWESGTSRRDELEGGGASCPSDGSDSTEASDDDDAVRNDVDFDGGTAVDDVLFDALLRGDRSLSSDAVTAFQHELSEVRKGGSGGRRRPSPEAAQIGPSAAAAGFRKGTALPDPRSAFAPWAHLLDVEASPVAAGTPVSTASGPVKDQGAPSVTCVFLPPELDVPWYCCVDAAARHEMQRRADAAIAEAFGTMDRRSPLHADKPAAAPTTRESAENHKSAAAAVAVSSPFPVAGAWWRHPPTRRVEACVYPAMSAMSASVSSSAAVSPRRAGVTTPTRASTGAGRAAGTSASLASANNASSRNDLASSVRGAAPPSPAAVGDPRPVTVEVPWRRLPAAQYVVCQPGYLEADAAVDAAAANDAVRLAATAAPRLDADGDDSDSAALWAEFEPDEAVHDAVFNLL